MERNKEVKISVIVLTYNQKSTIKSCLESILKQEVNLNFEVLIGDDSSTDGTSDICEKFALKHSNVFHIKRMKNIGMINNYIDIIKKTKV